MESLLKSDKKQIIQTFILIIFSLLFLLLCLQNFNYLLKITTYQNSTYLNQVFSFSIVGITFFAGMQAFMYITYCYFSSSRYVLHHQSDARKNQIFPHVTILIPTYNEPPAIVEKVIYSANSISSPVSCSKLSIYSNKAFLPL